MPSPKRQYNGVYQGDFINKVAFPLGGIGAGMFCMEGTGALSHFSLRHSPDVNNEPQVFAGLCVKGHTNTARVIEGPVPMWKAYGMPGGANGGTHHTWGLPRFGEAEFHARFPFGTVTLRDDEIPMDVSIEGWSPFTPGEADDSSLPLAGLEYSFKNTSATALEAVFSFNAANFLTMGRTPGASVACCERGFTLLQPGSDETPWDESAFRIEAPEEPDTKINAEWFRGGWFDKLTIAWNNVASGACFAAGPYTEGAPSPGASLYVPFTVQPGATKTIRLLLSWYVPYSEMRHGRDPQIAEACGCGNASCSTEPAEINKRNEALNKNYRPWYPAKFESIDAVASYWRDGYARLRADSQSFSDTFSSQTLPAEVLEAVSANLAILKSPTVLRQFDGRIWAWEGCHDTAGCCTGSCTHVWNYAQALAHLFPSLERSLRETEFCESQDERGHQVFRSSLPIREGVHDFHAASDGQLGGIIKVYREWRILGDTEWLRRFWPSVRASLGYCIEVWDPNHRGVLEEPHHNTYDIEFWGADGMCTSFYLGALQAAILMGEALGEDTPLFKDLLASGKLAMETDLWDGEYFIQQVQWEGLNTPAPIGGDSYSPEALALLQKEGPKYQYGIGCISDGVLGAWMAAVSSLPEFLDSDKLISHLKAVHKYNYRASLKDHANPQRPTFAFGQDGGLLLCSWPKGGALSLPFPYGNEVWTGIEYQVASHLMLKGLVEEGLDIVRAARDRYDGRFRDPFDEYECGHWYARAMSSYGLLQGLSGARYDAVEKVLYLQPSIKGDFAAFLSTETGYGVVGVRNGQPFLDVKRGEIPVARIAYTAA